MKLFRRYTSHNFTLKIYFVIFIALLFAGCEKVINVDLNVADQAVVIEGNVDASKQFAQVKISKTSNYFDQSENDLVSGADVKITVDNNESFMLPEIENGVYSFEEIPVKSGSTYQLSVKSDNKFFKGTSVMPNKVKIDTIRYYYDNTGSFFDKGFVIIVYFDDPPQVDNYYRIKVFVNGDLRDKADDFVLFTDRYLDGNHIRIVLRNFDIYQKDTVEIQLISLDEKVYDFYNTFIEILHTNPGSAAPANPNTNITNGALGYFSAWTSDSKRIIINK